MTFQKLGTVVFFAMLWWIKPLFASQFTQTQKDEVIEQVNRAVKRTEPFVQSALHQLKPYLSMPISDATFVDISCKCAKGLPVFSEFLKSTDGTLPKGQYNGVDNSALHLEAARDLYPEASHPRVKFFLGNDVQSYCDVPAMAQGDIIFLMMTLMMRQNPKGFLAEIYEKMKPGAWMVIIEPLETPEMQAEQKRKFPDLDPRIADLKEKVLLGKGLDPFISRQIETILEEIGLEPVITSSAQAWTQYPEGTPNLKSFVKQMGGMATGLGIYTKAQIQEMMTSIDTMQSAGWFIDAEIKTFLARKPLVKVNGQPST